MEQKAALIFERKKEERVYQFIIPVGAPFGEVFDVVFEMLGAAQEFSKQALESSKKALDEAKAKEAATSEGPIEN
jgi:hypothetical protein